MLPVLQDTLTDQEGDEVPCRVALRVLLVGGVARGNVLVAGHAQLAQEALAVLGTSGAHLVAGRHVLLSCSTQTFSSFNQRKRGLLSPSRHASKFIGAPEPEPKTYRRQSRKIYLISK